MPASGSPYRSILVCARLLAGLFCCALLAGCAEGPLAKYGDYNPWVKQRWDKEEAEYGPSFQTRVAKLRSLRGRAARLSVEEQERVSKELAPLVQDEPNRALRREVVLALGRLPTETAAVALRLALTDGDPELRASACDAWRDRGGPEALERLTAVINSDTDTDVRLAATRALGGFRDPAAIAALGVALDDTNPAMQHQAVESLRRVTGQDLGGNVAVWRDFTRGEDSAAPAEPSLAERFFKWQ